MVSAVSHYMSATPLQPVSDGASRNSNLMVFIIVLANVLETRINLTPMRQGKYPKVKTVRNVVTPLRWLGIAAIRTLSAQLEEGFNRKAASTGGEERPEGV